MNAVEIEEAISLLADQPFESAAFPYAFLEAFGNKVTSRPNKLYIELLRHNPERPTTTMCRTDYIKFNLSLSSRGHQYAH